VPSSFDCPKCDAKDLWPSKRLNWWEHVIALVGVKPYYCIDCDERFFTLRSKTRLVLSIVVVVLVLSAVWLVTRPSTSGQEDQLAEQAAPAQPTTLTSASPTTTVPTAALETTTTLTTTTTTTTQTSATETAPTQTTITAPSAPATGGPIQTGAKTEPAKSSIPGPPAPAKKGAKIYAVQFGAFRNAANARNMAGKIQEKGLEARVVKIEADAGQTLFKVWSGSYKTLAQARQAAKDLKQRTGMETVIASQHTD